ncbi:GNAT family N-acetyltransferase [Jiangella alkaliphila]|uniref:Predicted acetyltransferase, GNAT family n=1 Tax=Jiangella alkaliphila TaxID=419479 RepID=A0A1H2M7I9_9ACTN|nr:GNAT family N-acetyltransferase [Jiangella alkaliphila]SDU88918.1 Predicted acetyltransferase, GNAT family [Jiangella alkaliphila]
MPAVSIGVDAQEFWQRVHGWLERDPVLHSVLLTTVDRERRGAGRGGVFAILPGGDGRGGAIAGVAVWTPPFRAYVSAAPPGAERLALALLEHSPEIDGVTGVAEQSAAYAGAWAGRTGGTVAVSMDQRLFELDTVVPPRPSSGAARVAGPADRDLLVAWTMAFEEESNAAPGASVAERVVDLLIAEQRAYLWDDDGPACFVGVSRTVAGVARVAPVYTPPDRRRRGYASALVAAVSQAVLDAGASRSSLFTDLANPTSNRVYAALGYRPVADVTAYSFTR